MLPLKNPLHIAVSFTGYWRTQIGMGVLGFLLAAASLALESKIGHAPTIVLASAILLSLPLLTSWPVAALSAAAVSLVAVSIGGDLARWAITAIAAVPAGVLLRRGARPELAAGLQFGSALAGHAVLLSNASIGSALYIVGGAAAQAGASVALATFVLMLLPRRDIRGPIRCRVRSSHAVFALMVGTVSVAAVAHMAWEHRSATVDAMLHGQLALLTCGALLASLLASMALTSQAGALFGRLRSRRRDGLPLEALRFMLDTRRQEGRLQRAASKLSRDLEASQEEASRLMQDLGERKKELSAQSVQLRKLARAHEHARARYQTLLQNTQDPTLFADADGVILSASRSILPMLGFQPAELTGKPLRTLIPEQCILEHPLDLTGKAKVASVAHATDALVRSAKGEDREVTVHVHAFSVGTQVNYAIQLRDAGGMRKALAALEHARTLTQSAHRSRDLFIATMSHELRTPLHGLIATLEMMHADENYPPEFEQRLSVARISARALLRIANDVLDLTRIDSGHIPLEQRPFSLLRILEEVVDESRARAESLDLKLEWRVTDTLPSTFVGDPARLKQILGNLVSNALQYTQFGGVTLNVTYDGEQCTINVTDTGGGIPEDKWQAIFDPFVQVQSTRNRRVGGTGLGLPISRRLAEAMGGSLTLLRSDGSGSTFRLTVSLPSSDEPPPDEQSLRIFNNPRGRVLVVEDNAANRYVAEALLTHLECPPTLVENGEEALKRLEETEFDLILMDCQMPGMDGYETTRRARLMLTRRVPIIAMTANAMADHAKVCLEAGMDDFLPKPFGRQALHAILCKWLGPAPGTTTPAAEDFAAKVANLPALDPSVFEELRESLQWKLEPLRNIRKTFASSARETLALLDGTCAVDRRSVRRQLHTLLGSAGMVGARQVEYIARKLQGDIESNQRESVEADLALLTSAVRLFEIEFNRRLDSSRDEQDWTGRLLRRQRRERR